MLLVLVVGNCSGCRWGIGRIRLIDATPSSWTNFDCSENTSAGVFHLSTFLGRLFSVYATAATSSALQREKSVPLGKFWHSSPFVLSFVGRCKQMRKLLRRYPRSIGASEKLDTIDVEELTEHDNF